MIGPVHIQGSKAILIEACMSSLPMYLMGLFLLPEGVHAAFDLDLARFFWQGSDGRPKYHMVKWADLCLPKSHGGLGITASRRMNIALLLRWVWRILNEDGACGFGLFRLSTFGASRFLRARLGVGPSSCGLFRPLRRRYAWGYPYPSVMGRAPYSGLTTGLGTRHSV